MSSNNPFEDRLRQVLLAEAQTVTPAGDGLTQIRARVARRDRLRWLRPGLAVVAAGALTGAAVFAFSLGEPAQRTLNQDEHPATRPAASGAPAVTKPSPAPTSSSPTASAYPIWPYTSITQVTASTSNAYLDPGQTALGFMRYLRAPEVDKMLANETETTSTGAGWKVTLGRRMADGQVRAVTVVHLVRLGSGSAAPYAVTRAAGAYTLKISYPGIAASVRSPLVVSGTVDGVHQSVRAQVRVPGLGPDPIGEAAGPGSAASGWQATVVFNVRHVSGVGSLVARTDSDAGDGALQITAQPVLLTGGRPVAGPPVVKPAVDGDLDGDGRPDNVTISPSRNGLATVTAQLTRLGRQSVPMEVTGAPGVPVVMGVVDVDGDGYGELFVKVDQGASTGFASIVRLLNGRLTVVGTAGGQDRIPYGGTVTHLFTFGCAELDPTSAGREFFSWGGDSSDGVNYRGTLHTARFLGNVLAPVGSSPRNVAPTMPAPSGCGSLRYP